MLTAAIDSSSPTRIPRSQQARIAPMAAGQVVPHVDGAARDAGRVEDDEVRVPALLEAAPLAQAVETRGLVGQAGDRLLDREQPAIPGVGEQHGREREGVDHVEMGPGVRGADQRPRIAPELRA